MKYASTLLALVALALPAGAEIPCGPPGATATVDPPVAGPGQSIDVTLINFSSQSITFYDSCVYHGVYPNTTCEGDPVAYSYCYQILTRVPSGQRLSQPWSQNDINGQQVPNGSYSFLIEHDSGLCCATVTVSGGVPATTRWGMSALVGFIGLAGILALQHRRTQLE